jgi:inorganic phosphate transporter, PiT family
LLILYVGLGVLFILAFANGANDVGKSVVSLMRFQQSGVMGRRPLLWGGVFSGLGSVAAILVSGRLLSSFTPRTILITAFDTSFVLAVLVGAALWVVAATFLRLPVSTTHAILGAIMIQGIVLYGISSLAWDFVAVRIVFPLAGGPLAAMFGIYLFDRVIKRKPSVDIDEPQKEPKPARLSHWGSAAATALARGVNDAPKMAVLGGFFLAAGSSESVTIPYLIVAAAVVVGSMVLGHRVALTLTRREVSLDHQQRLKAGLTTAALVSVGAVLGAPLSSTHVHAGASAGASGLKDSIKTALRGMVLPWLVTLPAAGLLATAVAILGPKVIALG